MTTFRKHALALVVLSAITATGCGNDSKTESGRAGSKHTGVITGFGSVYVNGVKYNTDRATVSVEHENANMSDLEIGMVVTLVGSVNQDGSTGVATHISYCDELEGVVSDVNLAVDGTGTLTVMGQIVNVDANTTFESKVEAITGMTLIEIGNIVEVSGYSDGDGNIVATRVEVKKDMFEEGDEIEVKGVITDLDVEAKTFMLGALMVHYDGAEVEHTLANGLYVEVKSATAPTADNMLIASEVEVEEDELDGEEGDEFELEGVVNTVISETEFELNGQTVLITSGTEFEDGLAGAIAVGAILEVEGRLNADGQLVAEEIEFRHGVEIDD